MRAEDINSKIELISDNADEINSFIESYKPFIAACTQRITGKFVRFGEDDELSIALSAFEKAIKHYSREKGNFLSFAELVIKNSIIDYKRKEKKYEKTAYMDDYRRYETGENPADQEASIGRYREEQEMADRRAEILELKKQLAQMGISLTELEKVSPKSKKTRVICNRIITEIIKSSIMRQQILEQNVLPLALLEKQTGVRRKKFERHRKYIMAVIVILEGEYEMLREYIDRDIRMLCWGKQS